MIKIRSNALPLLIFALLALTIGGIMIANQPRKCSWGGFLQTEERLLFIEVRSPSGEVVAAPRVFVLPPLRRHSRPSYLRLPYEEYDLRSLGSFETVFEPLNYALEELNPISMRHGERYFPAKRCADDPMHGLSDQCWRIAVEIEGHPRIAISLAEIDFIAKALAERRAIKPEHLPKNVQVQLEANGHDVRLIFSPSLRP